MKITKKEKKTFTDYLRKRTEELMVTLHLTGMDCYVNKEENVGEEIMSIGNTYPYVGFTLYWTAAAYQTYLEDLKELDRYLIHELSHMILRHLYQMGQDRYQTQKALVDEYEKTTEHVSKILHDLIYR